MPLAMPATPATDAPIVVPFELDHDAIVVQATIDGQGPFDMLLDSGVLPAVVDLATARRIGLVVPTHGDAGSGGGSGRISDLRLCRTCVSAVYPGRVDAVAVDLPAIGATFGRPIVLGYSVRVVLDRP